MGIKFTIVTVTYNAVSTLEKTMLSVIGQKWADLEYIIIDGKSTDGTVELVQKYSKHIDYFISEPDRGVYDAMNKGLDAATGDFLLFLGGDDVLYDDNVLANVSQHIKDFGSVYYGNVYRDGHKDFYCGRFNKLKLAVKNICHQAIFYPRDIYKKHKYQLSYKLLADHVMNIWLYPKYRFIYMPVVVSVYSENGMSTNAIDADFERDRKQIICESLGSFSYYYYKCRNLLKIFVKQVLKFITVSSVKR